MQKQLGLNAFRGIADPRPRGTVLLICLYLCTPVPHPLLRGLLRASDGCSALPLPFQSHCLSLGRSDTWKRDSNWPSLGPSLPHS